MLESVCDQFSKAKVSQADEEMLEGVINEQTVIGFKKQRKRDQEDNFGATAVLHQRRTSLSTTTQVRDRTRQRPYKNESG